MAELENSEEHREETGVQQPVYALEFANDGTDLNSTLYKNDYIVVKVDAKKDGEALTKEEAESKVLRFYDYDADGQTFDIKTVSTLFNPTMSDESEDGISFKDVIITYATPEMNGKKIRVSLQENTEEAKELAHLDFTLNVSEQVPPGVTLGSPTLVKGERSGEAIVTLNVNVNTTRTDIAYEWLKDGRAFPMQSNSSTLVLPKEADSEGTFQLVVKHDKKHGRYRRETKSETITVTAEHFHTDAVPVASEPAPAVSADPSASPAGSAPNNEGVQPAETPRNDPAASNPDHVEGANTHTEDSHATETHIEEGAHGEPGRAEGDTHAADPVPGTASPEEHHDAAPSEGAHNDSATHEAGHENPQGSEASTGASQPAPEANHETSSPAAGTVEKHNEENVPASPAPAEHHEETHTEQPQGDASPAASQGDAHTGTPAAETHEPSAPVAGEPSSPAPVEKHEDVVPPSVEPSAPAGETSTGGVKPVADEKHDEPPAAPGVSTPTADQGTPSVGSQPQPGAEANGHTADASPAAGTAENHPVETHHESETSHSTDTAHQDEPRPNETVVQPQPPVAGKEEPAPVEPGHTDTTVGPSAPEHRDEVKPVTPGASETAPAHGEDHSASTGNTDQTGKEEKPADNTETQPAAPEKRGIKLDHTNLGILHEGSELVIKAVATPEEKGYELAQCQWMNIKDGVASPVAGQNTAELRLVITPDHGGEFYLTAYNGAELVMSEHAKATHIEYKDVEIIVKPETQLLNKVEGDALNLEVTAVPSDHVVFRWKKEVNGQETSVEGGTQNTLHIEPLRLTDAGDYFIEGERLGKVFARRKVSTVEVAPRKVEVPFNPVLDKSGELSEAIGKTFTLTVTEPNATENTVYSWYRTPVGGQPALLPGQNTNVLTISDLKVSDAGVYYVEVSETNRAPVRSAAVTLNVIPEPETMKPQPSVPGTDGTTGDNSTTDPYDGSKVQGDAFGYKHTLTNLSVATFRQYAQMMNPASRIDPLTGLEWQIRLYETLMTILKTDSIDVYMEAMDAAVDFFYTYSGSLFAMENRARFLQYATDSRLPKDSREALLELFNVFYTMGNPGGPEDRWDLKEIKDILRNSVAYARLSQYYDRKYKAMKSAEISGRVRNFI